MPRRAAHRCSTTSRLSCGIYSFFELDIDTLTLTSYAKEGGAKKDSFDLSRVRAGFLDGKLSAEGAQPPKGMERLLLCVILPGRQLNLAFPTLHDLETWTKWFYEVGEKVGVAPKARRGSLLDGVYGAGTSARAHQSALADGSGGGVATTPSANGAATGGAGGVGGGGGGGSAATAAHPSGADTAADASTST